MSVVTKTLPKLYNYLVKKRLPALVADVGGKNINFKTPLTYCKSDLKNAEAISQKIKDAYREYSISPYINVYLREGAPISAKANELYLALKEGINRSEKIQGVFVRGLNPRKNHPINLDTIGDYIFNNKGFTSTAPQDKAYYANTFAGYKGALVKFEITKPMKAYKADNGYEVIFDTNAFTPDKFKILPDVEENVYKVVQL